MACIVRVVLVFDPWIARTGSAFLSAVRANAAIRGCPTQLVTRISSRRVSYATANGLLIIVPGVLSGEPRMMRTGAVSPDAPRGYASPKWLPKLATHISLLTR